VPVEPAASVSPDPRLTAAVEHDIALGRRLTALTWLITLLVAVIGLLVVHQATLPVSPLAGTPLQALVRVVSTWGIGLVAALLVFGIAGVRWLQRAIVTMEALAAAGAVDAAPDGGQAAGLRRVAILFRPAGVPPDRAWRSDLRAGSGRRLAWAAAVATVLAISLGVVALGLALASPPGDIRRWQVVGLAAASLSIVASMLAGSCISDVGWRMAVAARAAGVPVRLVEPPGRAAWRVVPALLIFGGIALPMATASAGPGRAESSAICGARDLECHAVDVPVDYAAPTTSGSLRLVYGVHRASAKRIGTLVVAVGGPGGSGLEEADGFLRSIDHGLLASYDIVFWDQRGVGRSDGHNCAGAARTYAAVAATATSAKAFVDACLQEARTGRTGLERYATSQAAEDVEAIREQLGVDAVALYGESYGTELAQIYAAAHPDHLTALILDGAVDLTLDANHFWSAATRSFERSLEATFKACATDADCADALDDPAFVYDDLIGDLNQHSLTMEFADNDGVVRDHTLTKDLLESAVDGLLYEPLGRMLILRGLAARAHGDYVPIARLADVLSSGVGSVSEFAYHAITCADYRVSPTADDQDIGALTAVGVRNGVYDARTDEIYLAQLPCLYWPDQPDSRARPAPLTKLPVPVIVLAATLDPITPVELGRDIARRAADGYLIETVGGPHVTFGRGDACVDRPVVRFLLTGEAPVSRTIRCSGSVTSPYVPPFPEGVKEFDDALDAMTSLADELVTDPTYLFWVGSGDIQFGCRFGGTVTIASRSTSDVFTLDRCELSRGWVLDGTGTYDLRDSTMVLDVSYQGGALKYSEKDGTLSGYFRGHVVDLHP